MHNKLVIQKYFYYGQVLEMLIIICALVIVLSFSKIVGISDESNTGKIANL